VGHTEEGVSLKKKKGSALDGTPAIFGEKRKRRLEPKKKKKEVVGRNRQESRAENVVYNEFPKLSGRKKKVNPARGGVQRKNPPPKNRGGDQNPPCCLEKKERRECRRPGVGPGHGRDSGDT